MLIKSVEDLGKQVRAARKAQGLTQKQLAGLVRVGERFIVEVENGKPTAEIGKVFYLLQQLGLSIDVVGGVE